MWSASFEGVAKKCSDPSAACVVLRCTMCLHAEEGVRRLAVKRCSLGRSVCIRELYKNNIDACAFKLIVLLL